MLKPLHFIPDDTHIPFMKFRMAAFIVSGAGILLSIAFYLILGLNYGIDFRGGTLIEVRTEQAADIGRIRQVVSGLDLGDVQVQEFGAPEDVLIRVELQKTESQSAVDNEKAQQEVVAKVRAALDAEFQNIEYRRTEVVGPKVSGELVRAGTIAVVIAVVLMLIYIWLRFEWQFSVGAVLALVHDVILTIGIFSVLQIEFNLSIIAALLTIVGYSMNDTVVVYDRVRETLRKYKQMPLGELLDEAINATLSRTLMTSGTTLLALVALFVFGGQVIKGFTFAMIWGIVVGTYSSIFIASALLLVTGVKRDWSGNKAETAKGFN